jgi:hypothetical protein
LANFTFLDPSRPEIVVLMTAMLQARDAVDRHPLLHTDDDWWADVLADPRAHRRERRTGRQPRRRRCTGLRTSRAPGRPLRTLFPEPIVEHFVEMGDNRHASGSRVICDLTQLAHI